MHKNLKLLFLLTIVSPFSLSGLANEEIEEEIVVVASRTPTLASEVIGSVTSISQADIELQMIDGLEQLLDLFQEFHLKKKANMEGLSLKIYK